MKGKGNVENRALNWEVERSLKEMEGGGINNTEDAGKGCKELYCLLMFTLNYMTVCVYYALWVIMLLSPQEPKTI